MASVSVEMKRNCGSGRDALRAIARELDRTAVRTIMVSRFNLRIPSFIFNAASLWSGARGRCPVVELQNV
jgi:hypothetical protein